MKKRFFLMFLFLMIVLLNSINLEAISKDSNENEAKRIISYSFEINIVSGTKNGKIFKGTFSYDINKLTGKGDEKIEVSDINFTYYNVYHRSNFDRIPIIQFKDGKFVNLIFVGGPQTQRFGLNDGFNRNQFQRSSEEFIRKGKAYFGYLNERTYVDGAGTIEYKINTD